MLRVLAITTAILITSGTAAQARSCYDLWYARNEIYARNGYCFSTDLGRRVFGSWPCWTTNPRLSRAERARVNAIRAQEMARGCKVNN